MAILGRAPGEVVVRGEFPQLHPEGMCHLGARPVEGEPTNLDHLMVSPFTGESALGHLMGQTFKDRPFM